MSADMTEAQDAFGQSLMIKHVNKSKLLMAYAKAWHSVPKGLLFANAFRSL